MVMTFKAGNHLRFAEALVAISIYANAFSVDAQVPRTLLLRPLLPRQLQLSTCACR